MRWEDIDLRGEPGRITLRQTKNNEIHHVVLDPVAKRTLIELRELQLLTGIRSEWVFCNDRGERFHEIRNAWKTACKRAGLADKAGKPRYRIHVTFGTLSHPVW